MVHNETHVDVVVHTSSDKPREVGDAVAGGVSTATQKTFNAALTAVTRK
jgi:hypothetical protein